MSSTSVPNDTPPLDGLLVVDVSRMLPGAVLARQLLDLGARLIKVEEPGGGDPMRMVPPLAGGIGIGFAVLLRGAQSVALDLREATDADRLRALMGRADVVVESFRPGTLERWGLDPTAVREANSRLVWCSLSSYGQSAGTSGRIGHDLNFAAATGALRAMAPDGVPGIQLADVSGAIVASSAILAALLRRERGGSGCVIDQPLIAAPLPYLTWSWAEEALGQDRPMGDLLSGRCACYRCYTCGDGVELAVGALEPKFWLGFIDMLGLPDLAAAGHDPGDAGRAAAERVAAVLAQNPSAHWLELTEARGLPVSRVDTVAEARRSDDLARIGLTELTPLPDGGEVACPGPFVPSLGRTPDTPAPQLGEHTDEVLREFGIG